jgi:hypothetical protein
MTDRERDEVDVECQTFFRLTEDAVQELAGLVAASTPLGAAVSGGGGGSGRRAAGEDMALHRQGVVDFLGLLLAKVRLLHKELKAFRMKARLEKREMCAPPCLCPGSRGGQADRLSFFSP